ncbi:TadE/TadG family type IV pilus assembly protein [Desulfocurvus sp. DL9XJH121]
MLEFALVLPVLLAMCFSLVEAGNIYFASATVDKAAQVGARYAVTGVGHDDGTRVTLITQAAEAITASLPGTAQVSVRSWGAGDFNGDGRDDDPGCPCELVEVRVTYGYTPVTPIIGELIADGLTLTGRERMINEPWLPCD